MAQPQLLQGLGELFLANARLRPFETFFFFFLPVCLGFTIVVARRGIAQTKLQACVGARSSGKQLAIAFLACLLVDTMLQFVWFLLRLLALDPRIEIQRARAARAGNASQLAASLARAAAGRPPAASSAPISCAQHGFNGRRGRAASLPSALEAKPRFFSKRFVSFSHAAFFQISLILVLCGSNSSVALVKPCSQTAVSLNGFLL